MKERLSRSTPCPRARCVLIAARCLPVFLLLLVPRTAIAGRSDRGPYSTLLEHGDYLAALDALRRGHGSSYAPPGQSERRRLQNLAEVYQAVGDAAPADPVTSGAAGATTQRTIVIPSPAQDAPVIRTPLRVLRDHTNIIASVAFSPNGAWLAAGSTDGTVLVWNTSGWTVLRTLQRQGGEVLFSPSGSYLLTQGTTLWPGGQPIYDGEIWSTLSWNRIGTVPRLGWSSRFAFSGDGRLLVGDGFDSKSETKLVVWDMRSHRILKEIGEGVRFLGLSRDGSTIAASSGRSVGLWDVASGRRTTTLPGEFSANEAAFSPDGQLVAIADGSSLNVGIWDTRTGKLQRMLVGHTNAVEAVAFSPDGKTLASASQDRTARLWDVRTGRLIVTFDDVEERVEALAFSPDGRLLATGDCYAKVKIWQLPMRSVGRVTGTDDGTSAASARGSFARGCCQPR
ncbi:MAG TPA: WD40 repeat domain-containing protein [Armatimonadota bacterium]|nr:WD40 repeat domain-containing protein [Armatimonadota bacterium]